MSKHKSLGIELNKAILESNPTCTAYAMRLKDKTFIGPAEPCFASMKGHGEWFGEVPDAIVINVKSRLEYYKTDQKKYKTYLKWLLNDSKMAYMFKTKDVSSAMRVGVYLNTDMTNDEYVAAGVAVREGWELNWFLDSFFEIKKITGYADFAYLIGSYFSLEKGVLQWRGGSGHTNTGCGLSEKDIAHYLQKGLYKSTKQKGLAQSYSNSCLFIKHINWERDKLKPFFCDIETPLLFGTLYQTSPEKLKECYESLRGQ